MQTSIKREREMLEKIKGLVNVAKKAINSIEECVEDFGNKEDMKYFLNIIKELKLWETNLIDRIDEIKRQSWDTW
jgi:hypothetical protein